MHMDCHLMVGNRLKKRCFGVLELRRTIEVFD